MQHGSTTLVRVALAGLLALALSACGGAGGGDPVDGLPGGGATVTFETPDGGTYRVLLTDPADIVRVEAALAGDGHAGIPNGRIVAWDGGVNIGHDWHVVEVELADMAIEVCDGTVGYVDDLGHDGFVDQHGDRFCPWAAVVVAVDRAP